MSIPLLQRWPHLRIVLLICGALSGLVIAGADLVTVHSSNVDELPSNAIARIGNRHIMQADFERVARDLAIDKKTESQVDRRFALQRMIEEELLVQRGIELGFPESAPGIRKAIAAAVVSQVVAEAEALSPSDEQLRAFYADHADFFTQPDRWRVRWFRADEVIAVTGNRQAATQGSRITACNIEDMTHSMQFELVAELPNQLLPLVKLMDYMGPTLARRATKLQPGHCTEPIVSNESYNVLYLEAYQPSQLPAFDEITEVVENEYIRRSGESALRDYLKWLRMRAAISVDEAKLN